MAINKSSCLTLDLISFPCSLHSLSSHPPVDFVPSFYDCSLWPNFDRPLIPIFSVSMRFVSILAWRSVGALFLLLKSVKVFPHGLFGAVRLSDVTVEESGKCPITIALSLSLARFGALPVYRNYHRSIEFKGFKKIY